jgi:hypothetical protein
VCVQLFMGRHTGCDKKVVVSFVRFSLRRFNSIGP